MLGEQLKILRELKKKSQQDVCSELNVEQSTLANYENNKRIPKVDILIKLAQYYNVSVDYLLGLSDDKNIGTDKTINEKYFSKRLHNLLNECDDGINFCSTLTKIPKDTLQMYIDSTKQPSVYDVCKLIEVLNTTADYLFGKSDIAHPIYRNDFKSSNAFPYIFDTELGNNNLLKIELSDKLNISVPKIERLLSGEEIPEPNILFKLAQLLEKSTDYLLGLVKQSRSSDSSGIFPFKMNLKSIERIQSLLGSDTDDYITAKLNLTDDELFNLYHYGFIPHINVINKLCDMFSVSADYLLGLSDSKLSIIFTKDVNEDYLLKSYRQLDTPYQKKIDGTLSEQLLQQERDSYMRSSVAADEHLKKTGTDNLGK